MVFLTRCLDAESARRVVELRVAPPVQERIDTLAGRANEGLLTDDERAEYEALINAADFISILKVKARGHLLSKHGVNSSCASAPSRSRFCYRTARVSKRTCANSYDAMFSPP